MQLKTISQISKAFGISTRTLRYYEELGLISSQKKEDYAYRTYSEDDIKTLQQVLILRKLRIPLKAIAQIFQDKDSRYALEIFTSKLAEIDDEVSALKTIRTILDNLVEIINKSINNSLKLDFIAGEEILKLAGRLSITKIEIKENISMNDLNEADKKLGKHVDMRIVYLPPMTVASCHFVGDNPEEAVWKAMDKFVAGSRLFELKPDLRAIGYNNPEPDETGYHGYECWVSIPEDFEVPAPLVKKTFSGGLYAGHCIRMGDFEEWQYVFGWLHNNDRYDYDKRRDHGDCIEEHLNAYTHYKNGTMWEQLDLLIPIKEKTH